MNKKCAMLVMLLCCSLLSAACSSGGQSGFSEEIENAIDDGSITHNMMEISYLSEEQMNYLAKKLTQFQNDNDIEKALALIYAAPEGQGVGHSSFLDGQNAYATDGFINWIKNAVLDKELGTEDYEFKWDASRVLNQFSFKKKDSDVEMTVLANNTFYKKTNKYVAGLSEPSNKIERDFSNIHSSSINNTIDKTYSSGTYGSSSGSPSNSNNDDSSNSSGSSGWGKCSSCHQKEATHGVFCDDCYYDEVMELSEKGISPTELDMWANGYGWYDDEYFVGE